ncbi:succinyldiaminopimelate aminotransferase apoenzyme [Acidothermus cellulolyticus 11B]|jgi:N-succinyldiaminopimelate aminotransferase|uniref:Succinyldiaminopimelate aminotransferase apoenzyme n=1 Tax=Acidothermus cellulolyticus (strain ATCC 43068 / DSM 8971 / 11B) TaxID=351607 RepID=A0LWT3_ACIC1|nr:pyridoxal phosphate-dependent aminotransferase [Acidothermus cellulolyticus]ABK53893.1 succinyldiaminopimelate aminotransferase apoenzyme [Acidothermus cellulolyticus 11B]
MVGERLVPHLRGLGTTIFAEMSARAEETDAVNLGQGFPDVDGPDDIKRLVADAIWHGPNQYAPGIGFRELREAVAAHQKRFYGLEVDPDSEVLITAGATEAVTAALLAFVDAGDDVIALEPYYDSYAAAIAMARGRRVPVTLHAPDFRLDIAALQAAVTPRTKVILLNSPHNPTGTVLTEEELRAVAEVAVAHDLLVITDEVYEHLVYEGRHIPIATFPGMWERTVTISSAGKTFAFTGWKIGWVTGPEPLVSAVRTVKQFLTYTNAAPMQRGIAAGLGMPDAYFQQLAADLARKRDFLCTGLAELGFTVYPPAGTYFVTVDVRPLGYLDGLAFCRDLPYRVGVAAIPHVVFYDHADIGRPLVRFAFCKREDVLAEALRRLARLRG